MVEVNYRVIWDQNAVNQLAEIYAFILENSYQNAQSVRQKIFGVTAGLTQDPRRYNADKLRLDHNPDFRAVEIYKYRITFYINEDEKTVNILRVRSIRQDPLIY